MMSRRSLVLAAIALIVMISMVSASISVAQISGEGVDTGTRAEALLLDDGTLTLNSNKVYTSITLLNNSILTINSATVLVYGKVYIGGSSTFDAKGSTITLKYGILQADCNKFKLSDTSLTLMNTTTPDGGAKSAGAGENGFDSSLIVRTAKDNIAITGSQITVTGSMGGTGSGSAQGDGGNGGSARVSMETNINALYKISFTDSSIRLLGGDGGASGPAASNKAGDGGDTYLDINSHNKVEISNSEVNCSAGSSGGVVGQGSYGVNGESMDIKIRADDDILVSNGLDEFTTFWSSGGSYDSLGVTIEGNSQLKFISGGSIVIDETKQYDNEYYVLTNITAKTVYMEAPDGGFLYNVRINNDAGAPKTNGDTINIFWYLYVHVFDNGQQPLENADVTILYSSSGTEAKTDSTDSDGMVYILLKAAEASTTVTQIIYNIQVATRGVEQTWSNKALYKNTLVEFPLTLVSVAFTSIQEAAPQNGMTVGGLCVIRASASPPPVDGSHITLAQIKIDGIALSIVPDGDDTDPLSSFHAEWDTEGLANGVQHTLTVWASDGNFNSEKSLNVTVRQDSVNHVPEIIDASIPQNSGGTLRIASDSKIYVNGSCYEPDHDSAHITEGKSISKIRILFLDGFGFLVKSGEVTPKATTVGNWTFSYRWDVNEKPSGSYLFPDGEYTACAFAVDDGIPPLVSLNNTDGSNKVTATLRHIEWPKLSVKYEEERITDSITVTTGKGASSITLIFDASDSYDPNGPNYNEADPLTYPMDLTFSWKISRAGKVLDTFTSSGTEKRSTLEYPFTFTPAPEEKKLTYTYEVTLSITDDEGLLKEITFNVIINIIGSDKVPMMPLAEITGMTLPVDTLPLFIIGLLGFIVMNGAAGGALLLKRVSEKKKLGKRLKGLEIRAKLRTQQFEKQRAKEQFLDYKASAAQPVVYQQQGGQTTAGTQAAVYQAQSRSPAQVYQAQLQAPAQVYQAQPQAPAQVYQQPGTGPNAVHTPPSVGTTPPGTIPPTQ